ncbi:MAG: UDP-N-acetylmuramate--L-alanine ligase, partial [Chlamydiota bacterium]
MKEESYHFIGIGGIGMSALARILKEKGNTVQGSDLSTTGMVETLQQEGIKVFSSHDEKWVDPSCKVIYSTAIEENNPEYQKAISLRMPLLHRSDLLQELMEGFHPLFVTGTHGKTTTSALLSTVLVESEMDPSFVVGGIVRLYGKNARRGLGSYFVAEADESDGSFLKGNPFGAIITNLEREHMDHWKTEENLDNAFSTFAKKVISKDHLFWCKEDLRLQKLSMMGTSYGFQASAALRASDVRFEKGGMYFTVHFEGKDYKEVFLPMIGRHNVLNALAVFGLSLRLGISEEKIRRAFSRFQGTKRRQEYIGEVSSVSFFDDYGHHPTEIKNTLEAFQES